MPDRSHFLNRFICSLTCLFISLILAAPVCDAVSDSAGAAWDAPQTREFLQELEACHRDTTVMAASFRQQKKLKMLREPLSAQGYICFAAPGRLRFEIVQPFQSVLLYRDESISRFEKEDGQWKSLDTRTVRVMSLVMGQIAQWMQGKFEDSQVFAMSVTQAAGQEPVLHLTPSHERFREVIAGIDLLIGPPPERPIQQITVREPDGDNTEIIFTQIWRGITLPDALFQSPEVSPEKAIAAEKAAP